MSNSQAAILSVHTGVRGFYTLQVRTAEGEVKQEAYFQNLITDAGLDMLGESTFISLRFALGTGTGTPAPSDTTLTGTTLLGTGSASVANNAAAQIPPYKTSTTWSQQSAQGGVAGTWTEVAIGAGTTAASFKAFSRALIQDASGSPTSITILPTEFLTVLYTLELIVPADDVVGVVGIHTFRVRAASATSISSWGMNTSNSLRPFRSPAAIIAYSGPLAAVTSSPTGALTGNAPATFNSYVAGSFELSGSCTFSITSGNGTIRCITLPPIGPSVAKFQCEVDPPIVKNNTQTLTIGFRFTWGRAI